MTYASEYKATPKSQQKSECSERNYFTLPQSDCRPSYSIIQC